MSVRSDVNWVPQRLVLWLLLMLWPMSLLLAAEPLSSWRDSTAKTDILEFVQAVTDPSAQSFVPPAERIAVFDNDGTLWSEQPAYFEILFALDEVKRMAPEHPEWKATQPFKAVLENDQKALAATGLDGLTKIVGATHAGITNKEFTNNAKTWLSNARHPTSGRPYTDMVFQPMIELLKYLRSAEFKTYIVSGGEVTFMRAFAEEVYGIPPEQIIGTTFVVAFQDGENPSIMRTNKLAHNNDGHGKPEAIDTVIGRRPIFAFGNSDGDLQMLEWTASGEGKRFMGLVHHTDGEREWAYDRNSKIGHLGEALDQARKRYWTVVDMKNDWIRIHPHDSAAD